MAAAFTRSQPMRLLSMGISEGDRVQPITKDNRRIESKYRARLQKTKLENFKPIFSNLKKRCELILSADGGHIEINQIIKHTKKISFFSSFRIYIEHKILIRFTVFINVLNKTDFKTHPVYMLLAILTSFTKLTLP